MSTKIGIVDLEELAGILQDTPGEIPGTRCCCNK